MGNLTNNPLFSKYLNAFCYFLLQTPYVGLKPLYYIKDHRMHVINTFRGIHHLKERKAGIHMHYVI